MESLLCSPGTTQKPTARPYDSEQKYISAQPSLFGFLNDSKLMAEYSEFSTKNRSSLLIFLFTVYFTGAMISSIDSTRVLHNDHKQYYDIVFVLSHIQWILSFATSFLCWILFIRNLTYSWPDFSLGTATTQWFRNFGQNYQYTMLMALTLSYAVRLVIRVLNGKCEHGESPFQSYVWNCNPAADMGGLPFDTVAVLMFCPILYTCIMRETRFEYLVLSYIVVCFTLVFCALIIRSTNSITFIAPYMVFGILILYDSYNQNILSFLNNRKLKQTLIENEKMAASVRAVEMRHLIGNVAHDLKTPLTSFMTGVEFIAQTISDCDSVEHGSSASYAEKCRQSIQSIKQVVHDIRGTNSFMLMAINRCVDYTKASVGLQLVPKNDRVDLVEVLKVPLCIVHNMQETRTVNLLPLPTGISRYVQTDSQWLQENLLCLLSNAIKYSPAESTVNLSVRLVDTTLVGNQSSRLDMAGSEKILSKNLFAAKSDQSMDEDEDDRTPPVKYRPAASSKSGAIHPEPASPLSPFPSNQMLLFRVEDEGMGISEDLRDTLFSAVQQSSKRHTGGVGLGLYSLAKRIEALGGACGVDSQTNGKNGSVFWFAIPYFPAEVLKQPQMYPNSKVVDKEELSITRIISSPELQSRKLSRPDMMGMKTKSFVERKFASKCKTDNLQILVVEDSPVIAKMIRMTLLKDKHHVVLAENGQVGYDLVQQQVQDNGNKLVFDVIITDLQMPVMDGMEFTRHVRAFEQTISCEEGDNAHNAARRKHIIIGTSAKSDDESSTASLNSGADAFIPKPFSMTHFYNTLSAIHRERKQAEAVPEETTTAPSSTTISP